MLRAQRFWGETVSLLDVMWPRSNQWDCALLRRNLQLYNNLSWKLIQSQKVTRARSWRASCVNCYFTKSDVSADVDVQFKSSCSFQRKTRFFDATDIYYATSIINLSTVEPPDYLVDLLEHSLFTRWLSRSFEKWTNTLHNWGREEITFSSHPAVMQQ